MMYSLSLCHSVQTESTESMEDIDFNYKASSPDELALVSFANEMGFRFIGKNENYLNLYIKHTKETLRFELIQTIEFNSFRKRMSVVLKD